jgi:hypothetical protein
MLPERDTVTFDYGAPAELFMAKRKGTSRQPLGYRRFATAAEAICFAVEEFPAAHALVTLMQVGDERFDGDTFNVFTREMITHCDGVCQIDRRHDGLT